MSGNYGKFGMIGFHCGLGNCPKTIKQVQINPNPTKECFCAFGFKTNMLVRSSKAKNYTQCHLENK